jgi:hypothetical protein
MDQTVRILGSFDPYRFHLGSKYQPKSPTTGHFGMFRIPSGKLTNRQGKWTIYRWFTIFGEDCSIFAKNCPMIFPFKLPLRANEIPSWSDQHWRTNGSHGSMEELSPPESLTPAGRPWKQPASVTFTQTSHKPGYLIAHLYSGNLR